MTDTPRVLSLREVAQRLDMKPPNVRKFLERRGVQPAIEKDYGFFWWASDIDRVKAEREADTERLEADRRRRQSALRNRNGSASPAAQRLGARQRAVLRELSGTDPVVANSDAVRLALRRLRERGLVTQTTHGYELTASGRDAAGAL